jgi:MFS family permease
LESTQRIESYRWVILVVVYLSILAFTLIFQSIPPLLPLIISELNLNYAQSGLVMSLFSLPGIFVSLLGGFVADRYGMRSLGAGCFLLMIGGTLLVGLGMDLPILWVGRIVAGIGGFTLSVFLPKLLSQWFRHRELGLAMGIYNTGVPMGSVICFGLFGKMGSLWGWRIPILLTVIYLLSTFILFLILFRLPPSREIEENTPVRVLKSLKEMGWSIWFVGFSWLWYNAAFSSFATFAPNLFLLKNYTIEQSGLLIGIPLLGSLLFSAPVGYLVDRFKHQEWFIGMGAIGLAVLALFFNFSSLFLLLVILMGIFSAMIPAPIYSLPPKMLKTKNVGLGFGVISTCSSIGLFVAPYLVGKARDLTSSYNWSFVLISVFFFLITIFIFFTRRSRSGTKKLAAPLSLPAHTNH